MDNKEVSRSISVRPELDEAADALADCLGPDESSAVTTAWPAFADLTCNFLSSPRRAISGEAVILSPEVYEHARRCVLMEEIMLRRGIWAVPCGDKWVARLPDGRDFEIEESKFSDPATAVIEADRWLTEHEGCAK